MMNEGYQNLYKYCFNCINDFKNLKIPFHVENEEIKKEIEQLMEETYDEYMDASYILENITFSKFKTKCFELLERELYEYFKFCDRYSQKNLYMIAKKRRLSDEETKKFIEVNGTYTPIEHLQNFIKERLIEFVPNTYLRKNFAQDLKLVLLGKKEVADEFKVLIQLWDTIFKECAKKYREVHNIQNFKTTYNEGGDVYETLYEKYYTYVLNCLTNKALETVNNLDEKANCNELFKYNSKLRNYLSISAHNAFYDKNSKFAPTFECSIDITDDDNDDEKKSAVKAINKASVIKSVDIHEQFVIREQIKRELASILAIDEEPHRILSYLDQVIVGGYEYICDNPKATKVSYKPENTLKKYQGVNGFVMKNRVQAEINNIVSNIFGYQLSNQDYLNIENLLKRKDKQQTVGDKVLSEYTTKANTIGQWRNRIGKMLKESEVNCIG